MEPTANELHAGCLGNVNATWTFHGRRGHSARPWLADNAIERAARGDRRARRRSAPAARRVRRADVHRGRVASRGIAGGIARNVIPDRASRARQLPLRARPHGRRGRGAAARAVRRRTASSRSTRNAPQRAGRDRAPARRSALIAAGDARRRAQAGVDAGGRVRARGLPAVNFGPGDPRRRTAATSGRVAALRAQPTGSLEAVRCAPEPGARRAARPTRSCA